VTHIVALLGACAVVAGVLLGEWRGPSSARALLVFGLLALLLGLLSRHIRMPLVLCALVCFGAGSMQRALDGLEHSALTEHVEHSAHGAITGELVDDPEVFHYSARVRVRVGTAVIEHHEVRVDRVVLVRASGDVAMRLGVLDAGDRVTLAGGFEPLAGWDRRERWRHAVAVLRADDLVGFEPPRAATWKVANALRRRVVAGLAFLPETERALASSYLLGDDRAIPPETLGQFRAAGMTHLLVVSGSNVAFALALFGPLLRRMGIRSRFVAGIGILVMFGTMTRWEPSVLRAVVMSGLVMVAMLVGRPTGGVRVLAIAVTAIVLADPFLVHSIAFQLSCAATGGIAILARPIAHALPGPRWTREAVGATLGAEIGVAPVLVAVFGTVPLASIPANVLAAPPVGIVTVGGLAAGVAGGLLGSWLPEVAALLPVPVGLALRYERAVAAIAARVPLDVDGTQTVIIAVLVGLVVAWWRARRLRIDAPHATRR